MDNIACFVINLDRSPDRLAETTDLMAKAGIPFTRIAAIDGKTIPNDLGDEALPTMGRRLNPGEVGCFLSHRVAAEAFLRTGAELGFIAEDDVSMTPQSATCLAEMAACWRKMSIWDVANLARPAKKHLTQVRQAVWDGPLPLFHAHYMPVTTTALLWTRGGAQAFLMMSEKMQYPVDVQIQKWVADTDRGLAFRPPPFGARSEESTIQASPPAGSTSDMTQHKLRLQRLWHNHNRGLRHRLVARGIVK